MSQELTFSDLQGYWATECITQLAGRNIISGYPDGRFRPDAPVTRAEFAALVSKAFPNAPFVRGAIAFTDVPAKYWAIEAITAATRAGFLSGFPDRTFKPNLPIARVQVLVALVSGLKLNPTANPGETLKKYFDDAAAIPAYATDAVAAATQRYLVVNYPQVRRLWPNRNATRGEVAALICRALNLPGVPLQYISGTDFVVIQPQFDGANAFSDGLAQVKVGKKWGYIDKTGKFIIQPQYDEADDFHDGLALVRKNHE